MRLQHLLCGIVFLLAACQDAGHPVRVMTFNIHHGEGLDGRIDLKRIAETIQDANPDIVALQEVDSLCGRSGGVDQAAELARLTGLQPYYGMAFAFDGGRYGNAVLTRFPVRGQQVIALPGEPRSLLILELSTPSDGREFSFFATHLDTEEIPRRASVALIRDQLEDQPELLAGDLNALRGEPTMAALGQDWQVPDETLPTFPTEAPHKQIDYILFRSESQWRLVQSWVSADSLSSDHRALVADFQLQ